MEEETDLTVKPDGATDRMHLPMRRRLREGRRLVLSLLYGCLLAAACVRACLSLSRGCRQCYTLHRAPQPALSRQLTEHRTCTSCTSCRQSHRPTPVRRRMDGTRRPPLLSLATIALATATLGCVEKAALAAGLVAGGGDHRHPRRPVSRRLRRCRRLRELAVPRSWCGGR